MKQFNKNNLGWLILIALVVAVLYGGIMTNIISPFYQITLVTILLNIILAIGLNLVIGFSGQFWGSTPVLWQSGHTAERLSVTKLKAFLVSC